MAVDFRILEWPCITIMMLIVLGLGVYWAMQTGFLIWWIVVGITLVIILILFLSIPSVARKLRIPWFK
jgi:hypothetical protein